MKIKSDFITNSSSASYVIALKKGMSTKNIKEELLKGRDNLENFLDLYSSFYEEQIDEIDEEDEEDELVRLYKSDIDDERIEVLAEIIAEDITSYAHDNCLEIGEYLVFAADGSSEDFDIFANWLFDCVLPETDNLKISKGRYT